MSKASSFVREYKLVMVGGGGKFSCVAGQKVILVSSWTKMQKNYLKPKTDLINRRR